MFGQDFPISEYYRDNIIDAETVTRSGSWWTAVLLIDDPKIERSIIMLYQWQKVGSDWKIRKRFAFKKKNDLDKILEIIQRFRTNMT